MSTNNRTTYSCGTSFFSILGLVFIVLKLCKVIDWSWWLVLLPLYGGFAIAIILIVLATCVEAYSEWRNRR